MCFLPKKHTQSTRQLSAVVTKCIWWTPGRRKVCLGEVAEPSIHSHAASLLLCDQEEQQQGRRLSDSMATSPPQPNPSWGGPCGPPARSLCLEKSIRLWIHQETNQARRSEANRIQSPPLSHQVSQSCQCPVPSPKPPSGQTQWQHEPLGTSLIKILIGAHEHLMKSYVEYVLYSHRLLPRVYMEFCCPKGSTGVQPGNFRGHFPYLSVSVSISPCISFCVSLCISHYLSAFHLTLPTPISFFPCLFFLYSPSHILRIYSDSKLHAFICNIHNKIWLEQP